MEPALLHIGREALLVALAVSAPPLLAALTVGILTGVGQAATQIQEPAIGVVPRIAVVLCALAVAAPWIAARLVRFASQCLELASRATP